MRAFLISVLVGGGQCDVMSWVIRAEQIAGGNGSESPPALNLVFRSPCHSIGVLRKTRTEDVHVNSIRALLKECADKVK